MHRYMSRSLTDLDESTVKCKLDLVAGSLFKNMYGKHLVVTHDDPECLLAVADAVNARIGEEGGHPETPPGFEVWRVGSNPRPPLNGSRPFLCLMSDGGTYRPSTRLPGASSASARRSCARGGSF